MRNTVYDKAAWHIDAGLPKEKVIAHFRAILKWADGNALLSPDGEEILEFGVDDSVSLHSGMFTQRGNSFMSEFYDSFANATEEDFGRMDEKLLIIQ